MSANKLPDADLKYKYRPRLELSFILSLTLTTLIFYSFKGHGTEPPPVMDFKNTIIVEKMPRTEQHKRPPRPSQPTIPVASDDPDLLDDVSLDPIFDPEIDFEIAPPKPDEEEALPFHLVSVKPIIMSKGIPVYPSLAQKADIEGRVHVLVVINEKGKVINATLVGEENLLSQAALDAAMKCIFKPARQFDKFVKVKMIIPFEFKLR